MKERKEILDFGLSFPDVYIDAPFHDDNWILLRCQDIIKIRNIGIPLYWMERYRMKRLSA